MDTIRPDIEEFVVSWFRIPGQHAFVFCGLVRDDFFEGELCVFAITDAPETVCCDFRCHVVVFVMDDEVDIIISELV